MTIQEWFATEASHKASELISINAGSRSGLS